MWSFTLTRSNSTTATCRIAALLFSVLLNTFAAGRNLRASSASLNNERVSVMVYVESLCIDSKNYINEQLMPTYAALGSEVMDLQVISYGNARMNVEARSVSCQHGLAECDANSYEQCAAKIYPYPSRYLPFYYCLFNDLTMGRADQTFDEYHFRKCARMTALDWEALKSCHDNADVTWQLQKQAADATPMDHTGVPWVIVNGQHIDEEKQSLFDTICQEYQESGGDAVLCSKSVR